MAILGAVGCSGGGGSAVPNAPSSASLSPASSLVSAQSAAVAAAGIRVVQTARAETAAAATISIALPSAPAAGDLLVAAVAYGNASSWLSTPTGWTFVEDVSMGPLGQSTFWHVVAAGESGKYTWTVHAPAGTTPMTVAVQEVAGINASTPIAAHVSSSASNGTSATTKSLTASGALPLAFFAEYDNGTEPQYFNGAAGWTGVYTAEFAPSYAFGQEALYGTPSTGAVSATESWQDGANSTQVSELVLVSPGSSGAGVIGATTAAAPAATSTPKATPAPSPTPTATPVLTGAAHVRTWLYYGGDYENTGIPASYMAAHADFVEVGGSPSYGNNFIAAGGKYAVFYTDPHLVPDCTIPAANAPGSCTGPLGGTSPETAWLHDSTNTRLHTSSSQDALDPGSPVTQLAYQAYTTAMTAGTKLNVIMMDDTQPTYDQSYFSYKFGAQAAEVMAQSNPVAWWLSAQQALAAAAAQPVIYNGGDGDANDLALVASPNVLGSILEGCAVSSSFRVNDTQGNPEYQWAPSMNKLLATTAAGRYAVCLNYDVSGGNALGDRLYALGSWWLTYDPNWSVAFPDFNAPDTAGGAASVNFAEYGIVPTQPLTSGGTNIATLKSSTGAYVREFAECFQNGTAIGHCAAVVNPSYSVTVAMPELTQTYANSLVLTNQSAYNGGTATWTGTIPTSLGPETAVVLH